MNSHIYPTGYSYCPSGLNRTSCETPGHPTTFPTVLPSIIKVRWYPACLLEPPVIRPETANTIMAWVSALCPFQDLFDDHRRPFVRIYPSRKKDSHNSRFIHSPVKPHFYCPHGGTIGVLIQAQCYWPVFFLYSGDRRSIGRTDFYSVCPVMTVTTAGV